ncbi:MFS transporter [Fodinicurvata sp. EGI_FJ10296]|uniref:MFS transporter n=1 Tax=Fodinicurvata sp. EGI_FJ10296 TaxID=3231908 RepID=UPI0034521B9F
MMFISKLRSLPLSAWMLCLCQGLGLTVAVVAVNIGALAGQSVAPSSGLATVPYGLQFAALMLAAPLNAGLMGRFGRKPVFRVAAMLGMLAGIVGWYAVTVESFWLLCAAHALLGLFLGTVNLYRFAVLDYTAPDLHSTALSLVMFGGVFGAILGPLIAREAPDLLAMPVFAAGYLGIGVVSAAVLLVVGAVRMTPAAGNTTGTGGTGTAGARGGPAAATPDRAALLGINPFTIAVLSGAVSYGLMNLLMIAASLAMDGHNHGFAAISYSIQIHVLCMFFPSFFSGMVIERIGIRAFLMLGGVLQILASLVAMIDTDVAAFAVSLVLLGLAWNALYVGGSYLVGRSVRGEDRFAAQGVNEFVVAIASAAGALLPAVGLGLLGWNGLNVLSIMVAAVLIVLIALVLEPAAMTATADDAGSRQMSGVPRFEE